MIMNEDELIFDDEFFEEEEVPSPVEEETPPAVPDLTQEVLKLKGIEDINKIKFEDESGAVVERPWNSLSKEEQLMILAGNKEESQEESDLSDDEIDLLNAIRSSGMNVSDYLQSIMPQPQISYKIDELSDEDVYALDLLEKIGEDNITDEELAEAIDNAKKNETLFKKTVEGLRKEYIKLQQDEEARTYNELQARQEQAYKDFSTSIINEIQNLNTFAGQDLELSDEDKQNMADYMLNLDNQGMSKFGKDLQNPALFAEAAFWLLNKEAIIEELTKQIQDSYKRGFEAGKGNTNNLVFTKPVQKPNTDDFIFDEEDW